MFRKSMFIIRTKLQIHAKKEVFLDKIIFKRFGNGGDIPIF